MARKLILEIEGTSNFVFDVQGQWSFDRQIIHRRNSHPREASRVLDVFSIPGCVIRSSDGSVATLWTEFKAYLARIDAGATLPTYVRLVEDPDGTPNVVWTLGPADGYQEFKIEETGGEQLEQIPEASWHVAGGVRLVASAVKVNADADDVVEWDQEVSHSYIDGRHRLTWRTRVTTAEGTSAKTIAENLAKIDVSSIGESYAYSTNGPNGIDLVVVDPDERNPASDIDPTRAPTEVIAVSTIERFGITLGITNPNAAPNDYDLIEETFEAGDVREVATIARARGPGSRAWVEGQRPGGDISEFRTTHNDAKWTSEGRWVVREQNASEPDAEDVSYELSVEITGGGKGLSFEGASGGLPAVKFVGGGIEPWKATVRVVVQRQGGEGTRKEIKLPGPISGWDFSPLESFETEPEIEVRGADPAAHLWRRSATLVFYRNTKPDSSDIAKAFRDSTPIESYKL